MTTTSDKILEKIKQQHIQPDPIWQVRSKHVLFWLMFVSAIVVGGISFAVILDTMVYHDWDIYFYLHKNLFQYVMLSLPYIWILFLLLFSWFAYYNFRHTKGWYKHRIHLVILASILLGMVTGIGLFFLGVGRKMDKIFSDNIPYYLNVSLDKKGIWCHPKDGLLEGEVLEIKTPNEFVVEGCNGGKWSVESNIPVDTQNSEIQPGEVVKVIGQQQNEQTFVAKEVRDWDSKKTTKKESGNKSASSSDICSPQKDNLCKDEEENENGEGGESFFKRENR